jgi:APA family basic amino acid/polyamine antiporter
MKKLKKTLGLFDVYAVSTGAMFSSGFFLLPGLAYAQAGFWMVPAYLLAGLLMIPALLSQAELATAMPRSGGAYFFMDRALGPVLGTIGGIGTWLALVLKTAFALVGMGAYLIYFWDLPMVPVALALTGAFLVFNLVGAKETAWLQRVLVALLVGVLLVFVVGGLMSAPAAWPEEVIELGSGSPALLGTVALVFVSYAGLTKVASVAEEVKNPERTIPLGMILSLITASILYTAGAWVLVLLLPAEVLSDSLAPVAAASNGALGWLPGGATTALVLVVAAAFAAFASTGNAGILSASRYLFAMGRDRLLPDAAGKLGHFGTPTVGVVATAAAVALAVSILDVHNLAKLASAFQLLMFAFINLCVIVMRESRIEAYDPGYRSPLYPWLQIFGMVVPLVLIAELGQLALLFTALVVGLSMAWYFAYARSRVTRRGALFHWFAHLATQRDSGIESELRQILKERDMHERGTFRSLLEQATIVAAQPGSTFEEVAELASSYLSERVPVDSRVLARQFNEGRRAGATPVGKGVALPHLRVEGLTDAQLVVVRRRSGPRGTRNRWCRFLPGKPRR